MEKIEIRREILKMVYERYTQHPYYRVTPKEFKEELGISLRQLNFNIVYLEEKGLLELQKPLEGSLFVGARITPRGIDLVEDEFQFDTTFPLKNEKKMKDIDVERASKDLIDKIMLRNFSSEKKELLIEEVKSIRDEFRKPGPSYKVIKNALEKIKERDYDLGNELSEILKNLPIMNIFKEAAKREYYE
jgi:hypothetical protein